MGKNFIYIFFVFLIAISFPIGRASASYDAETEKFLGIINVYRVGNGHAALSGDALLQNAANWMSDDMLVNCVSKRISCSHTDSLGRTVYQRLQYFGYNAGSTNTTFRGGEIIAWGSSGLAAAERAFAMWKNSAVHNENMLRDSYAAVGISRTCEGNYCAWVVTFGGIVIQSFIYSPLVPFTPSSIEGSAVEGTPTPTLIPTSSLIPSSSPNSQNFSDGVLIRENGGVDIYIVKYMGAKKFKRLILSPSVFTNYGHLKWSDIKNVDQSVLDSFTTSDLVRAEGDPKVYKLNTLGDTGEKRWIQTAEIFNQSGFDWDAIYEINAFDRDSYVTGAN